MTPATTRNLSIVVLDGENPSAWVPWSDNDRNIEIILRDATKTPAFGAVYQNAAVQVNLGPIVSSPRHLLDSAPDSIVGIVLDPHGGAVLLDNFKGLCVGLKFAEKKNYLLFGLSVWILGEGEFPELIEQLEEIAYQVLGGEVELPCIEVPREKRLEQKLQTFKGRCGQKLLHSTPQH